MNRRTFIAATVGLLVSNLQYWFGGRLKRKEIKSHKGISLLDMTWDYDGDDKDPIDFIRGEPVVLWRWQVGLAWRNEFQNKVRNVHPYKITKLNVGEGWVEQYAPDSDSVKLSSEIRFERVYVDHLFVHILSPKGEILASLRRRKNECSMVVYTN